MVEQDERSAIGVTVEGVPSSSWSRRSRRFGTELVARPARRHMSPHSDRCPTRATRKALYAAVGLPSCPPELREAPFRGEPPRLVELGEIRGDLHCHTTWSDGRASVLEMAIAARELGYEYLAICDHTPNVRVVPGLDADALRRQADEIAAANQELAPFRVLRGAEFDIRRDGSLDLPDDVLAELDWVQAKPPRRPAPPRDVLTKQVHRGDAAPAVRGLSHPTGRYIRRRPENALDLGQAIEAALETGVALEVNGLPDRLDLRASTSGSRSRPARRSSSTDAHSIQGLGNMALAVHTARRGWATAAERGQHAAAVRVAALIR